MMDSTTVLIIKKIRTKMGAMFNQRHTERTVRENFKISIKNYWMWRGEDGFTFCGGSVVLYCEYCVWFA